MREEDALRRLQSFADIDDVAIDRDEVDSTIDVTINKRGDDVCAILAFVSRLRVLSESWHSNNELTDKGLSCLRGHSGIDELKLHSIAIGEEGFAALPTLPKLRDLTIIVKKRLDFACPSIGHCQNLEKLSFNGSEISDIGLKEFGSLSKLTQLDLNRNPVCKEIRVCVQMPRLKVLRLLKTNVDDEGLLPLRGHPQLRDIDLGDSKITDESGLIFTTIPNLKRLSLSETEITDKTGVSLGKAENLEFLAIGGTKITVETIRALKQATKLASLFLHKIVVDAAMLKALNQLPNLEELFIGGINYMRITQMEGEALHRKLKHGIIFVNDE